MNKRKILFLGETYRADAQTWMKGLEEFGGFEIISWELKQPSGSKWNRIFRMFEFLTAPLQIRKIIRTQQPDMVIAERTTSYGFLASLTGLPIIVIAQQGITDLWPQKSMSLPIKKAIQKFAFNKATLIHAWGSAMTISMKKRGVDMSKVLVLPKGIDLTKFENKNTASTTQINAIVTRSLTAVYNHVTILKAFEIINKKGIDFSLKIIGDGVLLASLKQLAIDLEIAHKVDFTGRINNADLPMLLQASNIYISMPQSEGVSASLFEAMASNCYPIVSDILGNQAWIENTKNGRLVGVNDSETLAEAIVWAFENKSILSQTIASNRQFVEENSNYHLNMKIIANQYHLLINSKSARKNSAKF